MQDEHHKYGYHEYGNGWAIYNDENIAHIVPLNDFQEHDKSVKDYYGVNYIEPLCECQPRVEFDENTGAWYVIHGAFDGREAMEEVNKILANSNI